MDGTASELPTRGEFRALVEAANDNDPVAIERLRTTLDSNPSVWRNAGNLAGHVEQILIALVAGEDQLLRQAIARQMAELRRSLSGPSPTSLVILAAERAVLAWLQLLHVEARIGLATSAADRGYWERWYRRADRRFQAACKAVAALQRLLPGSRADSAPKRNAVRTQQVAGLKRPSNGAPVEASDDRVRGTVDGPNT